MKYVILVGAPGTGKGTQAKLLRERLGFAHISTGDILRSHISKGTEVGKKAKEYVEKGLLVPDELITELVAKSIEELNSHIQTTVLDGYPRTVRQAQMLENLLKGRGEHISIVVSLEVPYGEIIGRLRKRAQEEGRMDDLNERIIQKRFEEFQEKTLALRDFFIKRGLWQEVDGTGTVEEVFERIVLAIKRAAVI